jgi:hypothetical protein
MFLKSRSQFLGFSMGGALLLAMLATGCGQQSAGNLLNSLQAKTYEQGNDVWASVSANLNISGFTMAAINIPIDDPNQTGEVYGDITLAPAVCPAGTSTCTNAATLSIAVDLTAAAKVQATNTELPNGTAFPLSLPSAASLIALPVGKSGAKIYIAFGGGTALVGAAIPFTALNGVGKYTPGLNLFDSVPFGNVTAYVGIFAGSGNDQTGLGLFADLSKVINTGTPTTPSTTSAMAEISRSLVATTPAKSTTKISLKPNSHSSQAEQTLYYQLWKESQSRSTLKYE